MGQGRPHKHEEVNRPIHLSPSPKMIISGRHTECACCCGHNPENLMQPSLLTRRSFCAASAMAVGSAVMPRPLADAAESEPFQLKYILGSCMYGYQYVGEILPEVRKTGATALDIWPKVHGNQREQLTDLGEGVSQFLHHPNAQKDTPTVKLRGLDPQQSDEIKAVHGGKAFRTGAELVRGHDITLPEKPAAAVLLLKSIK